MVSESARLCNDMLLHACDQIEGVVNSSVFALAGMVPPPDLVELQMKIVITMHFSFIGSVMANARDEESGRVLVDAYLEALPRMILAGSDQAVAMGLAAKAAAGR